MFGLLFIHLKYSEISPKATLAWFVCILDSVNMKPSTIITVISGAIASSGTVSLPDEGEDTQDTSINEARPPATDDIPGKNPFSLCRGDHSRDIVSIGFVACFSCLSSATESIAKTFALCSVTGKMLTEVG